MRTIDEEKEEKEEEEAIEGKGSRNFLKKNGGSRYHVEIDSFHISNKHCYMGFIQYVSGVEVTKRLQHNCNKQLCNYRH